MQIYQDAETGTEWHFDDGIDPMVYESTPRTLSSVIIPKPSEHHDWSNGAWVLNANKKKASSNVAILAQIAQIEATQVVRPTRELLIDPTNTFAKTKLATLDAQIVALRAQLLP